MRPQISEGVPLLELVNDHQLSEAWARLQLGALAFVVPVSRNLVEEVQNAATAVAEIATMKACGQLASARTRELLGHEAQAGPKPRQVRRRTAKVKRN